MPLNRKYWIFDLDGTITLPVHNFAQIREQLDIPADSDILSHIESLPQPQAQILRQQLDTIEKDLLVHVVAAPGSQDLISYLYEQGASLAILTRNLKSHALQILEQFEIADCFNAGSRRDISTPATS